VRVSSPIRAGALALVVACCLGTMLVVTGAGSATAARAKAWVTGAHIKNGTVTSIDVKDKSLRRRDFAAGVLKPGRRGLAGEQGPPGATGPEGPAGAPGSGRSATTYTWSIPLAFVRNGSDTEATATSASAIPAGQMVIAKSLTVTGCAPAVSELRVWLEGGATLAFTYGEAQQEVGQAGTGTQARRLVVSGYHGQNPPCVGQLNFTFSVADSTDDIGVPFS
jgi:hypothetical protein